MMATLLIFVYVLCIICLLCSTLAVYVFLLLFFQNTHYSEEEEEEATESQEEEREEGENEKVCEGKMPTVKTMYSKRQYKKFSFCCNYQSGDEEGYTADESGSDCNTEEEQVSSAYIIIENKL